LPARDFDPSEAAVSWQVLVDAGHSVAFATPDGKPAAADDMMLTGKGLDPWGAVPLLRALRQAFPQLDQCLRRSRLPRRSTA